jgi:putative FmdB family regulatory protein
MPMYEYLCDTCGAFAEVRPMAEYDRPAACPGCGIEAPRVILTAPAFSSMSRTQRLAHVTNERAANSPRTLAETKAAHGRGCSCCSGTPRSSRSVKAKNGAKTFPKARPWMISH